MLLSDMKMDNKTILAILALIVVVWLSFRILKALLPLILVAGVAFFAWRWSKRR